jgi:MFS family permease
MFDSTLMASSHPVITSYFNASNSASWLSTAFLLTSTALQPLFGRVSDTIGRRPLYLLGLLFLSITTAWCALAQSIGSFIAARAFCGLGAAVRNSGVQSASKRMRQARLVDAQRVKTPLAELY